MKNKICSIITMVLCVLLPICIFLPLIKLDLSPVVGELSRFFSDFDILKDGLRYSLFDILGLLGDYREDMGGVFWICMLCGLLPFLFPIIIFILSWLKGRIKYIINTTLAAVGLITTLVITYIVIPRGIEKVIKEIIDNSIAGKFLDLFNRNSLTDTFAENLAQVYPSSVMAGLFLPMLIILFALIIVVSLAGFFVFEKMAEMPGAANRQMTTFNGSGMKRENGTAGNAPALVGLTGIFKDAIIPVNRGEALVIGRDPLRCSVIIESTEISRKHCAVCFDEITGQYKVTDYSSNGTFINNERRIMKDQTQFVKRGEVISAGGSKNSFRLN